MSEDVVVSTSDLAAEIYPHMLAHNFEWRYGEELRVPTPEEIEEGIVAMMDLLKNETAGTSAAAGRLSIHKEDEGKYDIYVHFGTVKQD